MSVMNLQSRLAALQGSFSQAEQRVITLIISDPPAISRLGVAELARRAATSTATVVRASRRLGFEGYPALRLALAAELPRKAPAGEPLVADISEDDTPKQILHKLLAFEVEGASATAQLLSGETLEKAVSVLSQARRIDVYGAAHRRWSPRISAKSCAALGSSPRRTAAPMKAWSAPVSSPLPTSHWRFRTPAKPPAFLMRLCRRNPPVPAHWRSRLGDVLPSPAKLTSCC